MKHCRHKQKKPSQNLTSRATALAYLYSIPMQILTVISNYQSTSQKKSCPCVIDDVITRGLIHIHADLQDNMYIRT